MGVKTNAQIFKNWENPFSVELELDIFRTTDQTLKINTSLNRNIQDSGVLYSASLLAESEVSMLMYYICNKWYV